MHGVSAHTGFPRTLTITNYISAIFSTLNPILSVTNLSRLKCAETQYARKPRAYEYWPMVKLGNPINRVYQR